MLDFTFLHLRIAIISDYANRVDQVLERHAQLGSSLENCTLGVPCFEYMANCSLSLHSPSLK